MLYSELEGSTLEELIAAYRGPPLDGQEHRASFYDDLASEIARRGGIAFLEGELDQDDEDRLVAAIGALAFSEDSAVDRHRLNLQLQPMLDAPSPVLAAIAIEGLGALGDRTVHERVLELLENGPTLVRVSALIYLRTLFPESATPVLLDALCDPDATVRFTAVDQLDELEDFTDRSVFVRALKDPEESVREHARYILEHHFTDEA